METDTSSLAYQVLPFKALVPGGKLLGARFTKTQIERRTLGVLLDEQGFKRHKPVYQRKADDLFGDPVTAYYQRKG